MKTVISLLFIICIFSFKSYGQTGTIKGKILDQQGRPIVDVTITYQNRGTVSNNDGEYTLEVPSGKTITIQFSHLSFQTLLKEFVFRGTEPILTIQD